LLHLVRVARPVPTQRHPLAGLWKADYGPNGIQIVQVSYDFTGTAARIVAVKVCHAATPSHDLHISSLCMSESCGCNAACLLCGGMVLSSEL
jgi:hypothetical protein